MKKLLFGFCCLAFAGPVWAQPATPAALAPQVVIEQASHRRCDTSCPQECPGKVCVSEPSVKKTTRTVYGSKCLDFCLPKCALRNDCNSCCEGNCEHPRTKRVLLKKVVTDECPSTQCVVRDAPACVTVAPQCTTVVPLPSAGKASKD